MNHRLAPIACIALLVFSCACTWAQQTDAQSASTLPTARIPRPSPTATAAELVERAEILHAQKSYLDAADYYQAALKKENSPTTWNKLGITQLQMGRDEDARRSFEKAMKL